MVRCQCVFSFSIVILLFLCVFSMPRAADIWDFIRVRRRQPCGWVSHPNSHCVRSLWKTVHGGHRKSVPRRSCKKIRKQKVLYLGDYPWARGPVLPRENNIIGHFRCSAWEAIDWLRVWEQSKALKPFQINKAGGKNNYWIGAWVFGTICRVCLNVREKKHNAF